MHYSYEIRIFRISWAKDRRHSPITRKPMCVYSSQVSWEICEIHTMSFEIAPLYIHSMEIYNYYG